eukprot:g13237.t1
MELWVSRGIGPRDGDANAPGMPPKEVYERWNAKEKRGFEMRVKEKKAQVMMVLDCLAGDGVALLKLVAEGKMPRYVDQAGGSAGGRSGQGQTGGSSTTATSAAPHNQSKENSSASPPGVLLPGGNANSGSSFLGTAGAGAMGQPLNQNHAVFSLLPDFAHVILDELGGSGSTSLLQRLALPLSENLVTVESRKMMLATHDAMLKGMQALIKYTDISEQHCRLRGFNDRHIKALGEMPLEHRRCPILVPSTKCLQMVLGSSCGFDQIGDFPPDHAMFKEARTCSGPPLGTGLHPTCQGVPNWARVTGKEHLAYVTKRWGPDYEKVLEGTSSDAAPGAVPAPLQSVLKRAQHGEYLGHWWRHYGLGGVAYQAAGDLSSSGGAGGNNYSRIFSTVPGGFSSEAERTERTAVGCEQHVYIHSFLDRLDVMMSKVRPKKLTIRGTDGELYPFLAKLENLERATDANSKA